ncbi:hypothetical protein VDGD_01993 [Verticillium dahliae]|nr:hypothetical protein VDGD_01993 [Verticillium dahliae]
MIMLRLSSLLLTCLIVTSVSSEFIPGRTFDYFISIWLGKQNHEHVVNDPHIAELRTQGILLTSYYAQTHPSQPNYLAAIAGDYFGLDHDETVRIPINVSTVVDLLDWRGLSWKAYFEDLPGPGYMGRASDGVNTGSNAWQYVRSHNPFATFDSINLNGTRLLNLQSLADLHADVAASAVPQYAFVVPNLANAGRTTSLAHATSWASSLVASLLAPGALPGRSLILLTYDEAADARRPNRVTGLLLGTALPRAVRGTTDDTLYTHYAQLASLQFNWATPHLGRYDAAANVFRFLLDLASRVLVPNRDPPNRAAVNNSASYPGAFAADAARARRIPPPNLRLAGAGDRGVLDHVRDMWWLSAADDTPYDGSGTLYDAVTEPVYRPQAGAEERHEQR